MPSIENRIIALADALRWRAEMQSEPIDPLSASLFELERELAALDEHGKVVLLKTLNGASEDGTAGLDLDMEDLETWISVLKAS